MPQSLARIILHVVFSTKSRQAFLVGDIREHVEAYMVGVLRELSCPSIMTRCLPDHVHVLCHLSRCVTPAELVEEIKKSSSRWIKTNGPQFETFFWQGGYGAFSVSPSNVPNVLSYLEGQDEHHKGVSFQDEFRAFLRKHGVAFDEQYVWD